MGSCIRFNTLDQQKNGIGGITYPFQSTKHAIYNTLRDVVLVILSVFARLEHSSYRIYRLISSVNQTWPKVIFVRSSLHYRLPEETGLLLVSPLVPSATIVKHWKLH